MIMKLLILTILLLVGVQALEQIVDQFQNNPVNVRQDIGEQPIQLDGKAVQDEAAATGEQQPGETLDSSETGWGWGRGWGWGGYGGRGYGGWGGWGGRRYYGGGWGGWGGYRGYGGYGGYGGWGRRSFGYWG